MPVKILSIQINSIAEKHDLQKEDKIVKINNHLIEDFLDFQFYSADETLHIQILKNDGKSEIITIHQDWEIPLGIEIEQPKCRACINDCIFCFVHQMKPGLRKSLYLKDGDFRFSFVYGNFITLTNLTKKDFQKIIAQKLTPLYISVHTTNPVLHKIMLRYKKDFNILEKIKFLSENKIELHTQIVAVPDWNDGVELERTMQDLTSENLNISSIGIVPVGLTKYRNSLIELKTVNSKHAKELLKISQKYPKTYCSDEIYLLANEEIPNEDFYNDFPQLENGIGMIRLLLENWKINKRKFISDIKKKKECFIFITGFLAEKNIQKITDEINSVSKNKVRVQAITNHFFGESVTVSGLLSARDIISQTKLKENEIPVLSSNIFNTEGFTLDNIHLKNLMKEFNGKLLIIDEQFSDWDWI